MGAQMDLPEGPVTIMFTDIEGSTALRTTLGDAETDALFREHDELIRAADRGATRATTRRRRSATGSSPSSCRPAAPSRARSASSGRSTRSTGTASGPPLRVRIGLNTGEVAWQDGQLSGEAVHAAARVCAAGVGRPDPRVRRHPPARRHDPRRHLPRHGRASSSRASRSRGGCGRSSGSGRRRSCPQQVFVGREARAARRCARSSLAALDGQRRPRAHRRRARRREDDARDASSSARPSSAARSRCSAAATSRRARSRTRRSSRCSSRRWRSCRRRSSARTWATTRPRSRAWCPELRRRFPDIAEPLDLPPEQQRRYFFNAVGSFIARGVDAVPACCS